MLSRTIPLYACMKCNLLISSENIQFIFIRKYTVHFYPKIYSLSTSKLQNKRKVNMRIQLFSWIITSNTIFSKNQAWFQDSFIDFIDCIQYRLKTAVPYCLSFLKLLLMLFPLHHMPLLFVFQYTMSHPSYLSNMNLVFTLSYGVKLQSFAVLILASRI